MSWGGGIDFLRTIADALLQSAREHGRIAELFVLAPAQSFYARIRSRIAPVYHWLKEDCGPHGGRQLREALEQGATTLSQRWQLNHLLEALPPGLRVLRYRTDQEIHEATKKHRLLCVMPCIRPLSPSVRVPWIGYIYDFQHRHLPDMFSAEEKSCRDKAFGVLVSSARCVIFNSKDARQDCLDAFPDRRAELISLPFGASPRPDWLDGRPELLDGYRLPSQYFLVSNQFWKHKNHHAVFDAIRILRDRFGLPDVRLVCTGGPWESRDREYYPSLLRFLDENQLNEHVRLLGFIPKRVQIEVMKHALAVIQPSLFEGGPGGGAVYDAISLGVPVILSDIPVNRELTADLGSLDFFDPLDSYSLARCMKDHLSTPRERRRSREELIQAGAARVQALGNELWRIIDLIINERHPT